MPRVWRCLQGKWCPASGLRIGRAQFGLLGVMLHGVCDDAFCEAYALKAPATADRPERPLGDFTPSTQDLSAITRHAIVNRRWIVARLLVSKRDSFERWILPVMSLCNTHRSFHRRAKSVKAI